MHRIIMLLGCLLCAAGVSAATYYVDATGGNDTWSGTFVSPQVGGGGPWQTLNKASDHVLQPGDSVLLKRGEVWRAYKSVSGTTLVTDRLYITESGTPAQPIIIDAYGTGAAPLISGGRVIPRTAAWGDTDGDGVYSLDLGPRFEYYTYAPALVRRTATGGVLLQRIEPSLPPSEPCLLPTQPGTLKPDTYRTSSANQQRILEYRPRLGEIPNNDEFEVSYNGTPILITGSDVHLSNIDGMLANGQHVSDVLPSGNGVFRSEGARVRFSNCKASFSAAYGIVIRGPDSVIDGCSATHNNSTGLYIEDSDPKRIKVGSAPERSIIQNSRSEFNGNLEPDEGGKCDKDKGGIGVQGSYAIIRHNVVNSNGNKNVLTDSEDAAISVFASHDVTIEQNYIVNSVRNAIFASHGPKSYGHKILRNVIHNWNLEGVVTKPYQNTSAIYLAPFGNNENSGRFTVHNNTIYSDLPMPMLFGIQFNIPPLIPPETVAHYLNNTSVKNNIVYIKGNSNDGTRGLRISRNLFNATQIDNNNIYVEGLADRAYQDFTASYAGARSFNTAWSLFEGNSINNREPQFVATIPSADTDFDLAAGSPNLDKGAFVGLTEDYLGRIVPRGSAPDIGAFEYTASNLSIAKTASGTARVGELLTYTVTVLNGGPHTATEVRVDDALPLAATLVSSSITQGTCAGTTVLTCVVGTLNSGTRVTITINVRPTVAGTLTNTASVVGKEFDPNTADNTASVTTVVTADADLAVTQTGAPASALINANVTYTVTVRNNGPSATSVTTLTNTLPVGLSWVSTATTQGTCSGTVTCNLGSLANGASATVTITAKAVTVGAKINTAAVSSTQIDPNPANNTTSATITVLPSCATGSFRISGAVRKDTSGGAGIAGTTLNLTRQGGPAMPGCGDFMATTNGNYWFASLQNGTYSIVPNKANCTFTPTSRSVTVNNGNVSAWNKTGFVGTGVSCSK